MLELTVCFQAVTPRYCRQTGSGSEPSAISVVLLFCAEADVVRNFAVEYAPEFFVSHNTTTLFLHSVRLWHEDSVQEVVRWDEEPVVLTWLERKDPLADRTCVQGIFTPQVIQKLKVGEMEGKIRPMVDHWSTLGGQSGGEDGIEAQQCSGVIFGPDELGVQSAECFEIGFVSCFEHCDLWFSKVSTAS